MRKQHTAAEDRNVQQQQQQCKRLHATLSAVARKHIQSSPKRRAAMHASQHCCAKLQSCHTTLRACPATWISKPCSSCRRVPRDGFRHRRHGQVCAIALEAPGSTSTSTDSVQLRGVFLTRACGAMSHDMTHRNDFKGMFMMVCYQVAHLTARPGQRSLGRIKVKACDLLSMRRFEASAIQVHIPEQA